MADRQIGSLTRRTVLGATGALMVGGTAFGTSQVNGAAGTFVLEQGEECLPITPLRGDETAEDLYDWRKAQTQYSSAGTTDLQRDDTSILFLYRDPQGEHYLVVVHDRYDTDRSGSQYGGGSATFRFSGPDSGQWVVTDDLYSGSANYDRWALDQDPQQIDWTWDDFRTDGGVYGPLGDSFEVTIDPAFNEDAALFDQHYGGQITDWQVLSGDRSDPDRTSISMDEPIRIHAGRCEDEPQSGQLDVRIPQGRVNPRSRGLLAVDLYSTDTHPVEDVNPGTIRTQSNGVRPVKIRRQSNRDGVVRLFFRLSDVDLTGEETATIRLEAETAAGAHGTGSATVRLVPQPQRGRDEADGNRSGRSEDDGDDAKDNGDNERRGPPDHASANGRNGDDGRGGPPGGPGRRDR
ncbi:hypothetical protein [Halapricum hydrolyticum]|uniref:Uncharacterized protein n=1 Tax=Halapricum hydrolyticum TaxID=2979991 RepID=A0AAE3LI42_9EURY|nr:hypothetical protein [Halapricum hydrolyticum]MCU4718607.1 hypothetical protein [Halapricum hydrolyticum]MCU4727544.1 hypothetical protein [Halapricum hydrolyticum]